MQPDAPLTPSAGLVPAIRMLMSANALEDVRAAVAHGARLMARFRTLSLYEAQRSDAIELTFRSGEDPGAGGIEVEGLLREKVAKTGRTASTLDLFAGERDQAAVDEYVRRYGLCLARPLAAYGGFVGVLVVHYEGRVALAETEFDAVRRFADFAAVAVANARTRDELMSYAYSDPLTGLGNRRQLETELERLRDTRLALLLIDFDDLKAVNDVLGYEQGDALIKAIGCRLTATSRPGEVLIRLGGDEFVVIIPGADRSHAVLRAEEVTDTLDGLALGGEVGQLFNGASVGWATAEPGEDPWQVLSRAAFEMRSRKRRRKGDRVPADGGSHPGAERRLQILGDES